MTHTNKTPDGTKDTFLDYFSSLAKGGLKALDDRVKSNEQKRIAEMEKPLPVDTYFWSVFWGLYFLPNEKTGFIFKNRLEKKYSKEVYEYNRKAELEPLFPKYSQRINFEDELSIADPDRIRRLAISMMSFNYYLHSKYAMVVTYYFNPEEENNVRRLEPEIVILLNNYFEQNALPIRCFDFKPLKGKIQFLLGEKDRFHLTDYNTYNDEIQQEDNDFGN